MRITINGSANLEAIANRVKAGVTDHVHQASAVISRKIQDAKQERRAFTDNVKDLVSGGQKFGRSLSSLRQALNGLSTTIAEVTKDLDHWERANDVPLTKIDQVFKKSQK